MKKIIITLILCIACMSGTVSAADNSLTVSCSDSILTITGSGDISENELISFICVDDIDDVNGLNDDTVPYFIEAFNADNNEINVVLDIPQDLSGGKYYIVAEGKNFSASAYFIYIDKTKIESAIEKINSAKSPAEIGEILMAEEIDIDDEIYSLNSELINQILYTGIGDGYNAESFIDTLYDGYFASLVCEGKSEDAFSIYCKDAELSEQYKKIENIQDFEKIFKESDFENDSVTAACDKAFIASRVKAADTWKEIRNEILMSDDTNPSEEARGYFDFSDYEKIENKNSVFQKMAGDVSKIESFDELKKLFEDTAEAVYSDENKPTKGSGSSGGGSSSGGSSSGGMYSPVFAGKAEDEKEIFFLDIEGHWAEDDIKKLSGSGVINGYEDNTFRPDNYVTRAEMVKMICVAFGLSGDGKMNFTDISESDWHYKYINTAFVNGVVNGRGEYFSPNENITREDATVIMYRILSKNYPLENGALSFIDKSDISDYAKDAIGAMKNEGLIEGVGKNRFEPKQPITRAQCAVLINRCMLRFEITE